jgi:hypothetical protein
MCTVTQCSATHHINYTAAATDSSSDSDTCLRTAAVCNALLLTINRLKIARQS